VAPPELAVGFAVSNVGVPIEISEPGTGVESEIVGSELATLTVTATLVAVAPVESVAFAVRVV
jgi:hypothetical protein